MHVPTRVNQLLRERLHIEPPSNEADLLEAGLLDSLGLVALMAAIEEEFHIQISFEEIELDHFRSVIKIAEFVSGKHESNQTFRQG